ncbi:MAG: OmpH family outer membrane protein [Firmicutes bacterium]|jgi:Skp family chaperone for outer membrane proteins|nr:OmpH family outer membrane protein [Bacillota bacterium]
MLKALPKSLAIILISSLVIGVGAGLTNLAVSRAAGEAAVIGKIDGPKLKQEFPAMKAAWDAIAKQKAALEKELNSKAEGQDEETKKQLLDQYNTKYNEYARTQLEPAAKALENAIAAAAKEKGVNVVIDTNVVHLGGIDLTDLVMKKGTK